MKNQKSIKLTILALCLCALATVSFGQTKTNTKTALTRSPMSEEILKAMQKVDVKAEGPGALYSSADGKYGFAFLEYKDKLHLENVKRGANIGVIYVEANSKELPNGYYTVNLKQFATDEKGNPLYGFTLTNTSGVQALSIGAKTNGAAGNTNGTGAKRVATVAMQANGKDCPLCTVAMPVFKKTGKVETLSTEGLDTQIVESVAAFISSTKSNTKTA